MKQNQFINSSTRLPILLIALLASTAISLASAHEKATSFNVAVRGSGKPLVLIPGLSCSGEVWDATVEKYRKDYECHILTLAGFADVPPIQTDSFLRQVRDDLIHYIHDHSLDRVTLMGHSLGGFLALWVAAEIPSDIARLVIVDGLPFLPAIYNEHATAESNRPMAAQMRKAMANQPREERKNVLRQTLATMITAEHDIERALQWGMSSDQATVAQAMSEMFTIDLRDDIAKISSPTLVLGAWIAYRNYGATHQNTLDQYKSQFKQLANTQVWLTDTGNHFLMWDDPDGYFQQLDTFLK